jgi:hypothetical protein
MRNALVQTHDFGRPSLPYAKTVAEIDNSTSIVIDPANKSV